MPEVIEAAAATSVASAGVAAEVTAAPATEDKPEEQVLTPVEQLFQANLLKVRRRGCHGAP